MVFVAPVLHHGTTSYANVLGPLIGGIFAFGISRGYLQLLRDAAERTRISRDIHDTVAQALSSIRLLSHAGSNRTSDPDAARVLAQVEALAADSLADVRRIVAALAPAELEDDALAAALQRKLDRVHAETGLQVELHIDNSLPLLTTEVEVVLLRTAQSALATVLRHADANLVVVSLIDAGDDVRLDITDNGSGFDLTAWERSKGTTTSSFGLRIMRARLRELGGGLDVESNPGEGTAISAYLPIHAEPPRTAADPATAPVTEDKS